MQIPFARSRLSIRTRLLAASTIATSVAMLVAGLAFVAYDVQANRGSLLARLKASARILGYQSVSPLRLEDDRAARATLEALRAEPHVLAAAIFDGEGRQLAGYSRVGGAFAAFAPPAAGRDHEFVDGGLVVFEPVQLDGRQVGSVVIRAELEQLDDRLRRYGGIVALVLLTSVLVGLAVSASVQNTISAPLLHLADTARSVSMHRDFSVRAEGEGRDEPGQLVRTFNEMLEQIQAQDRELREASARLEERVAERTRELRGELLERRRAEEALRRSQLQLAEAQAIAHVGSWEWEVGQDEVRWSDEMYRVYGLDPAAFTATYQGFLERVHPDDRERVAATVARALEEGRPFSFDHRIVRPDGAVRTLHAFGSVVRDPHTSRPVRVLGTGQDVTERKAAEDERAQLLLAQLGRQEAEAARHRSSYLAEVSGALARTITDYDAVLATVARLAVPEAADWCAVFTRGTDDSLRAVAVEHRDPTRASAALTLARLLPDSGWPPGGFAGVVSGGVPMGCPDPPDVAGLAGGGEALALAGCRTALLLPLRGREAALGLVCLVMTQPGRDFGPVEIQLAQGLVDRAGLALDNARLYREAQQANRLKDEFLATLSHELRTPLNAIVGWTALLRSGQLDGEAAARALDTIDRNVRAQTRLIEDILDVSRVVTGKLKLHVQELALAPVVDAAIESVRPAAEAKGIRLQRVLDGNAVVVGDPARLQQVVWNLLANSVKFTPRGGRIHVRLWNVSSHVEVVVQDSGVGIAPEFLPHVFERFRQADSSSTRPHGGLGLGLAIVRHLVELHGGTVEAASQGEGRGARFTVRLPTVAVAEQAHPASIPVRREQEPAPLRAELRLDGLRVLVVDDESDTRELIATVLTRLGAVVVTASSGDEALGLLARERPDVLLSDIEMPGSDGYTLIRRVRSLPPEQGGRVPAAALTAYARSEDRLSALLAGFQVHLAKPIQPDELAAVLMRLSGRQPPPPSSA